MGGTLVSPETLGGDHETFYTIAPNGYKIHTFLNSGQFTYIASGTTPISGDILTIAGGGSGGNAGGGGGGGGNTRGNSGNSQGGTGGGGMIGTSPGVADGGENLGGGAHGSGSGASPGNGGKGIVVIRVPFPL